MTDGLPSSGKGVNRRLKAHRKSRRGCGNCKLRRVKCDESKPRCKKCTTFGVFCNYDCQYSDLQLAVSGIANIETVQILPLSLKQTSPSIIAPSLKIQSTGLIESKKAIYDFGEQDLELLNKFRTRTVYTITTDQNLHLYQKETLKLAHSYPYLMHAILSLTLMHDRYLSAAPNAQLSTIEAFHWYQGTALFNAKLSGPIQASERDATYATAACLGVIAFYYIEARTPEEAWPLKPPSSLDLNWLVLSDGKKELAKVTQPAGEKSAFQTLMPFENTKPRSTSSTVPGLEALPSEFIQLCGLDTMSNAGENPYYAVASGLAKSLHSECQITTILSFLSFIMNMLPEYKRLLKQKDPCALLLLAYWFAKMCQYPHWWIIGRAALEGQAICIYLQRYYGDEPDIQKLLQFPRMMCGAVVR